MIVVDTNVLAYYYLRTPLTEAAEELRLREPRWIVPVLWRSEFRSMLAGELRRRRMTLEQAARIQADAEQFLSESEFHVDFLSVLKLVRDTPCSAYDCEYVALAIDRDVELVTMDKELLRVFPERARPLA